MRDRVVYMVYNPEHKLRNRQVSCNWDQKLRGRPESFNLDQEFSNRPGFYNLDQELRNRTRMPVIWTSNKGQVTSYIGKCLQFPETSSNHNGPSLVERTTSTLVSRGGSEWLAEIIIVIIWAVKEIMLILKIPDKVHLEKQHLFLKNLVRRVKRILRTIIFNFIEIIKSNEPS